MWTAEFFTHIGTFTLHEHQFGPQRQLQFRDCEVSWLAVPFLSSIPKDTRLLRVVRNPYDVVISAMQMGFQRTKRGSVFDRFLATHRPDIVAPDDKLTRMILWATTWDAPMDQLPHKVIRPDADPLDRLGEVVDYATDKWVPQGVIARVCRQLGSNVNTKERTVAVTRDDIERHPEGWRIQERAERFGYV